MVLLSKGNPKGLQIGILQRNEPVVGIKLDGVAEPRRRQSQIPKLTLVAREVVVEDRGFWQPLHGLQKDQAGGIDRVRAAGCVGPGNRPLNVVGVAPLRRSGSTSSSSALASRNIPARCNL